jgi:hypothetical protein
MQVLLFLIQVWLTVPDLIHLGLFKLSRAHILYSPPPPHLRAAGLVICSKVKSIHSLWVEQEFKLPPLETVGAVIEVCAGTGATTGTSTGTGTGGDNCTGTVLDAGTDTGATTGTGAGTGAAAGTETDTGATACTGTGNGACTGKIGVEVAFGTFTVQIHSFPTSFPVQLGVAAHRGAQLADTSLLNEGANDDISPQPFPSLKRNCTFSPDLPIWHCKNPFAILEDTVASPNESRYAESAAVTHVALFLTQV